MLVMQEGGSKTEASCEARTKIERGCFDCVSQLSESLSVLQALSKETSSLTAAAKEQC